MLLQFCPFSVQRLYICCGNHRTPTVDSIYILAMTATKGALHGVNVRSDSGRYIILKTEFTQDIKQSWLNVHVQVVKKTHIVANHYNNMMNCLWRIRTEDGMVVFSSVKGDNNSTISRKWTLPRVGYKSVSCEFTQIVRLTPALTLSERERKLLLLYTSTRCQNDVFWIPFLWWIYPATNNLPARFVWLSTQRLCLPRMVPLSSIIIHPHESRARPWSKWGFAYECCPTSRLRAW